MSGQQVFLSSLACLCVSRHIEHSTAVQSADHVKKFFSRVRQDLPNVIYSNFHSQPYISYYSFSAWIIYYCFSALILVSIASLPMQSIIVSMPIQSIIASLPMQSIIASHLLSCVNRDFMCSCRSWPRGNCCSLSVSGRFRLWRWPRLLGLAAFCRLFFFFFLKIYLLFNFQWLLNLSFIHFHKNLHFTRCRS